MPAGERQGYAARQGRQTGAHGLVHFDRQVQRERAARGEVAPAFFHDRSEEEIEKGLLTLVGRHVFIALYHEIWGAGEDEIVFETAEVDSFARFEDEFDRRGRLICRNHGLVGRLEGRVRVDANIGDAEGHRGETATAPAGAEVENADLRLELAVEFDGLCWAKLVDCAIIELKDTVFQAEELFGRIAAAIGLDLVDLLGQVAVDGRVAESLVEGDVAFGLGLYAVLEEKVVEGIQAGAGEGGACRAGAILQSLVVRAGLVEVRRAELFGYRDSHWQNTYMVMRKIGAGLR